MRLNAWIEALSPANKARLAEELNKNPAAASRAYEAYTGAEALRVLRELFDIHPLGDFIYTIRECEGKGWDGPLVKRWAAALEQAEALIAEERGDMTQASEIVASWPPWKRNLLENSLKPTCSPRKSVRRRSNMGFGSVSPRRP